MSKNKWSKEEISQMNVRTIPTVTKAMKQGYFSRTMLERNKIYFDDKGDYVYAYAGYYKAYIKVYKSDKAFEIFKSKNLK